MKKHLITVALITWVVLLKGQNDNGSLFPLFGITPTVTTISEANQLGGKYSVGSNGGACSVINDIYFWDMDKDGIIEYIYMIRSDRMPKTWTDEFGFDYSLSYTEWMDLLAKLNFTVEVSQSPKTETYSGRNTLSAAFKATSITKKTILTLNFNYGNRKGEGFDVNSKNSLYGITIVCSGIELGIYKKLGVKKEIERYVNLQLQDWQKKGEFEKTADYIVRVSDENRKKNIGKWQQEKIDELSKLEANQYNVKYFTLKEYDADNETFLLQGKERNYVVPVPATSAQAFKQNFSTGNIADHQFILTEDGFKLSGFSINVRGAGAYTWSHTKDSPYQQTAINYNFVKAEINLPTAQANTHQNNIEVKQISVGKSDVDISIPSTSKSRPDTYVLVIGNEDYGTYQMGLEKEANVPFAANDAEMFAAYCERTIGVPKSNINLLKNATLGQMGQAISKLEKLAEIGKGNAELIFYYAGHGLPNEETKESYLIPVDVSGSNLTSGIRLNELYSRLGKFPTKKVTVLLDACFSGGSRDGQLVALRSVRIKPKEETIAGNMVVFTSSSGTESSAAYKEKGHGMFTYYLLKKLMDSKGETTYKEMGDYLQQQVLKQSVLINNKEQTPQVKTGYVEANVWGGLKF